MMGRCEKLSYKDKLTVVVTGYVDLSADLPQRGREHIF